MPNDPIVDEVRRVREELAARFDYDVSAIAGDARERQKTSEHEVVSREPRKAKRLAKK